MRFSDSEYEHRGGAWIHRRARVAGDVLVEPGVVIGAEVEIGSGCLLHAGAVIYGPTRVGEANEVYPGVVLGGPPQDAGYGGEPTRLEIGNRNVFREGFTANRASTKERMVTTIGSDCYFMSDSHVGHDSVIGDRVVVANGTYVAGHCRVEDGANLAGGVGVAQYCTVGRLAFVGGLGGVRQDVEPFICHDHGAQAPAVDPICINVVGLRRAGVAQETVKRLRVAFKLLFARTDGAPFDPVALRAEIERRGASCAEVEELLHFVERKRAARMARQRETERAEGRRR